MTERGVTERGVTDREPALLTFFRRFSSARQSIVLSGERRRAIGYQLVTLWRLSWRYQMHLAGPDKIATPHFFQFVAKQWPVIGIVVA